MAKPVLDPNDLPLRLLIRNLCVQQATKISATDMNFRVGVLLRKQLDRYGCDAPRLARLVAQLARGLSGATAADRDAVAMILLQHMTQRKALKSLSRIWTEPLGSEVKRAFQFSVTCGRVCLELTKKLREKAREREIENSALEAALVNVTRAAARFARRGIMHEGAVTSHICQRSRFQQSVIRLTARLRAFTENDEDSKDYVSLCKHIAASKSQTSILVANPPKHAPHRHGRFLEQTRPPTQPARRTLH
ncbi:hypothetical protein KBB27_01310 [Patescibacteria group bacterium]|nr:hypothetical protein [Patescibacteria group bacterium]